MTEQQLQSEFEIKMKSMGYSDATLRKWNDGSYHFAGVQQDYIQFKNGIKTDPVVEANRAMLHERSQVGIAKYGTTLGDAKLSQIELLTHALEETLDLANYLQAEIMRKDQPIDLTNVLEKERHENEVFLKWISSPMFQLTSHANRTLDLEAYMISKNREIADLEAEIMRLKNNA